MERSHRDVIEPREYTGLARGQVIEVDDDVTHIAIAIDRSGWKFDGERVADVFLVYPAIGGIVRTKIMSLDGGAFNHRLGHVLPYSVWTGKIPSGAARKVRVEIEAHQRIRCKCDVDTLVLGRIKPRP